MGDGADFAKYKEIIFQNSLKHVSLVGRRDPLQYYKDSAIFMMTSVHEGFGLTIVEAQNYGCVPIVFNSFSSVSDIITNRINGIIIPNNNITMYIAELKRIMKDVGCREIMSNNAIESAISFNIETIGRNWINILTE